MALKKPIQIGSLQLHNRLVMPPMDTELATERGEATEALYDYYAQRVRGGHIGLVILEHSYISQEGKANPRQLSIAEDACIASLEKLTRLVHRESGKIFIQLNHAGSMAVSEISGCEVVAPSSVLNPGRKVDGPAPRELTKEEILAVEDAFVRAALRGKAAGFDGVEIHSAHAYLLNQFFSPLTNHRRDAYGGGLQERMRIHLEILKKVRSAVGPEYPIAFRLGGCDYMEGGSIIQDAVEACRILEAEGVDLLDLSGGMCRYILKDDQSPGYFSQMSRAVKTAVSVPVILTGGITTREEAETLLREGAADLIGVGRAMRKDARWAERVMTG